MAAFGRHSDRRGGFRDIEMTYWGFGKLFMAGIAGLCLTDAIAVGLLGRPSLSAQHDGKSRDLNVRTRENKTLAFP